MGVTRTEIAAALSTVPGLKGYPRAESASNRPGDAYPRWTLDTRNSPGTFERAWTIMVHLPDDVIKREELTESLLWPITDALAHLIRVDTYGPDVIDERPVLIIIGRE